jgi:Domain of unknown function (DUF4160)
LPTISVFYGIKIGMFYNEHGLAHFHAAYAEFEAVYLVDSLEVIEGRLPRRAHNLVRQWARAHRDELQENWQLARATERLRQIAGLD